MGKMRIVTASVFIFTILFTGCAATPLSPFFPYIGASYQGFTIWEARQSTRYYASDLDTTYQAVKRSCEQLKLETVQNPEYENDRSLKTEGNHPMRITVLPAETNLTKVIIKIELLGDKPYVEFFFKTVEDNIPKKKVIDKEGS
ncbi:MAG TPA: DUF3568 family protein [Syntrophales bacterium]|nr:DUF3568 family protein [Syntrophales bacterium]